jgi:hypothetical protein
MIERYIVEPFSTDSASETSYRVTDTQTDSRIATCWMRSNADLVVAALNAALPPEEREQEAFAKGAAAQREADLAMFAKWQTDIELPFGGKLKSRHTFNVDYPDYVRTEALVKVCE